MGVIKRFFSAVVRRKDLDTSGIQTELQRCISLFNLVCIGVGSTLGLGIYMIAGQQAGVVGPSVLIAFAVAAVASIFAGLCYAEFGSRIVIAGSAYLYSYVTVGELIAFIIGWNMILEYVIGAAAVARGFSDYINFLSGNTISNFTRDIIPLDWGENFSKYPDFLAFTLTITFTVLVVFDVKSSTKMNTWFTLLNLSLVLLVIVAGSFKANFHYLNLSPTEDKLPPSAGSGGFFPKGLTATMRSASICFFSFVGFDVIASSSEEAVDPRRSVPLATIFTLIICFIAYSGISLIQVLMVPYYELAVQRAPLLYIFDNVGFTEVKWIVSAGTMLALAASLFGSLFPIPRLLYSMARDGIIFKFLARINRRFQTPVIATLLSGFLCAIFASLFDASQLSEMMSIGTLLAYSLVAFSVLVIRFRPCETADDHHGERIFDDVASHSVNAERQPLCLRSASSDGTPYNADAGSGTDEETHFWSITEPNDGKCDVARRFFNALFNLENVKISNRRTFKVSISLIAFIMVEVLIIDLAFFFFSNEIFSDFNLFYVLPLAIVVLLTIVSCFALHLQPQSSSVASFKVPLMPLVPVLSIAFNNYLMLGLHEVTWKRFAFWMILGFVIYFGYGIRKSNANISDEDQRQILAESEQINAEQIKTPRMTKN